MLLGIMTNHMRLTAILFAAMGLFLSVVITAAINGSLLETKFFPVNDEWTVTSYRTEGKTLVIEGTLVVRRQCDYIPPPQAKEPGSTPIGVISKSKFQNQQWMAGEKYSWGPWYIEDGVGKNLLFSQVHDCHDFWQTLTILGSFDARQL